MAFVYFGDQGSCGGGGTSTTSSSTAVFWMGGGGGVSTCTIATASTAYTGINNWTMASCNNSYDEQINAAQMAQMQQMQQMQMMQMQAQQIYMAQRAQSQPSDEQRGVYQAQLKKSEEAGAKAKELLFEHLTPEQKKTFNKNKWFVVEGGKSKQQYRIRAESYSINIEVLDGKKVSHKLCAHLHYSAQVPLHDHILAQKIMLESAEDDFLKIANRHAA